MGLNSQIGRLGTLERHRATCDTFPDRAPSALSIPKNQIIQCRLPREIFTENQTRSYLETSQVHGQFFSRVNGTKRIDT